MYNYPDKAKSEATHTDDNGYLYKKVSESFVLYWDRRFNNWYEEKANEFSFLIPL